LFTSQCDEASVRLSPGDRIYFYTDGITEAVNSEDRQFGTEGILETLGKVSKQSLDECLAALLKRVQIWSADQGLDDDVSILSFETGD
jgi:sigma-B regulation protein RsbU (phosphoserine phosphatase)